MELMTTSVNKLAEIIRYSKEQNIKPVRWFEFCSKVGDIWFNKELTWEQHGLINDWAWEVKRIPDIEYVFGAMIAAYNAKAIRW